MNADMSTLHDAMLWRTDALTVAKGRAHRRRAESGAVMFVVALTLTVLASVGMYALAAASTEIRTSGNERQSTQSHYLAEYGVLGTAHEMTASKAQLYLGLMLSNPDFPCVSLPGVKSTDDIMLRACRRLGSSEIGGAWTTQPTSDYTGTVPFQNGVTPGSLGPTPLHGDFFVELTGPEMANAPPRYALDLNFCFIQMTATSVGLTQPIYPGTTDPTAQFASEGTEMERARFIAGPVGCPK